MWCNLGKIQQLASQTEHIIGPAAATPAAPTPTALHDGALNRLMSCSVDYLNNAHYQRLFWVSCSLDTSLQQRDRKVVKSGGGGGGGGGGK